MGLSYGPDVFTALATASPVTSRDRVPARRDGGGTAFRVFLPERGPAAAVGVSSRHPRQLVDVSRAGAQPGTWPRWRSVAGTSPGGLLSSWPQAISRSYGRSDVVLLPCGHPYLTRQPAGMWFRGPDVVLLPCGHPYLTRQPAGMWFRGPVFAVGETFTGAGRTCEPVLPDKIELA